MNKPNRSLPASTVAVGITAYGSLLGRAGGEQLALVSRASDQSALAVVLYRSLPYDLRVPALEMPRLNSITAYRACRVSHSVTS